MQYLGNSLSTGCCPNKKASCSGILRRAAAGHLPFRSRICKKQKINFFSFDYLFNPKLDLGNSL
jgi:hypothetical protein